MTKQKETNLVRELSQFSPMRSKFCLGAKELRGSLGVAWCHAHNISSLPLCKKPSEIVAHYTTEPPAVNFVRVTTFITGFPCI